MTLRKVSIAGFHDGMFTVTLPSASEASPCGAIFDFEWDGGEAPILFPSAKMYSQRVSPRASRRVIESKSYGNGPTLFSAPLPLLKGMGFVFLVFFG